jgi:hypothetical protein
LREIIAEADVCYDFFIMDLIFVRKAIGEGSFADNMFPKIILDGSFTLFLSTITHNFPYPFIDNLLNPSP